MNAQDACKTKYPIVLVHGIGYKDNIFLKYYWGKIPKNLRKNGATVYLANVDALGTIENNAAELKDYILNICQTTDCQKVNIIAHSKGGLDARYMLSKLEMKNYVASLTLISVPNHGTVWADLGLYSLEHFKMTTASEKISYVYAKILADKNPNPMSAYKQCQPEYMNKLNNEMTDVEDVYYQSYGSYIKENYPNFFMKYRRKNIHKYAGDNDGVIQLSSMQWTNFKIIGDNTKYGVSHFDIIGFIKTVDFNEIIFFNNIARDLKEQGF